MKKKITILIILCFLINALVPLSGVRAVAGDIINLDEYVASSPSLFTTLPYYAPTEYVRNDGNNIIAIKASTADGTISMGYHGSAYLNETLKITAKFDGDFSAMNTGVWDAFYLRSQGNGSNLPVGNFALDKYMFTIPNTKNIQLYRTNNKVLTYLAPSAVPANIDLTTENEYELCAINNADSVTITLKINGVLVISYNDISTDRIVAAGYFGVAAYANSSTIKIGKANQVLVPTVSVDLDIKADTSPAEFMSTPYFLPSQYERNDANGTISFKGTEVASTVAMGYHGASFLDEALKFTAKFDGDFAMMGPSVWNAFYLRSQNNGSNMPMSSFSQDKYMFTFTNSNSVSLYRVNAGVLTNLATTQIPNTVNLTTANSYEMYAINNGNKVDICLKINETAYITISDSATTRIATAGYFGLTTYANTSTVTLGKVQQVIIPAVTVDLDPKAATSSGEFMSTPYFLPTQYERNDGSGVISFKGTELGGTVAMGYHGATYLDEALKFTAKFDGDFATMSPSVWNAFYIRSQNNGSNLPMAAFSQDKYMFTFTNTNAASLYRVNGGTATILATAQIPNTVILTAENSYEIFAINGTNTVDISLKINGTRVITFSDTAVNRIKTTGYFGVSTYANTSTIKLGKYVDENQDPMPNATKVNLTEIIGNPRDWLVNAPGLLKFGNKVFSFKGYEAVAGYTKQKFGNALFSMDLKGVFTDPIYAWVSVNLRAKKANVLPMSGDSQSYQLNIHGSRLVLYKNKDGVPAVVLAQVATVTFGDAQFHHIEYGTENVAGGVRIFVRLEGKTVVDVIDSTNPILEDGYLTLTSYLNNEISLKYNGTGIYVGNSEDTYEEIPPTTGSTEIDTVGNPTTADKGNATLFSGLMIALAGVLFAMTRKRVVLKA